MFPQRPLELLGENADPGAPFQAGHDLAAGEEHDGRHHLDVVEIPERAVLVVDQGLDREVLGVSFEEARKLRPEAATKRSPVGVEQHRRTASPHGLPQGPGVGHFLHAINL